MPATPLDSPLGDDERALAASLRNVVRGRRLGCVPTLPAAFSAALASDAADVRALELGAKRHLDVDVAVVGGADLAPGRLEDLRASLRPDTRLIALIGAADEGAFRTAFERLSTVYASVQTIAASPVDAVVVADLARSADDRGVVVDASLFDEDAVEPSRLALVAGNAAVALDSYAVYQLPTSRRGDAARLEAALEEATRARAEAHARAEAAHARAEEAHARAEEAHARAEAERTTLIAELEAQRRVGVDQAYRIRELTDESSTRVEALRAARRELAELRDAAGAAIAELGDDRLRAVASELRAARRELARRTAGERDLLEALQSTVVAATASPELVEAEARALEAELARDELAADLAAAERRAMGSSGSTDDAVLAGTVRGLRARAAELQELWQSAEGRLGVAAHDLVVANERIALLERSMVDAREHFSAEIARLRAKLADAERVAPDDARTGRFRVIDDRTDPSPEVAALRVEVSALRGERDGLRLRLRAREGAAAASAADPRSLALSEELGQLEARLVATDSRLVAAMRELDVRAGAARGAVRALEALLPDLGGAAAESVGRVLRGLSRIDAR